MITQTGLSKFYGRVCLFVLFLVAASASFNGFYEKWHFHEAGLTGDYDVAGFEQMIDGTANRPFVYRQLLPYVANVADRATPVRWKDWIYRHQASGKDAYLYAIDISPTAKKPAYFFRYLILYILTFLFALLAVYAMFLLCEAFGSTPAAAAFAAVIFILLVPYFMSIGGYFYDYSELAFFALAALIAVRFDWWWLIPLVALAELNKESFVLMVLTLYPLLRERSSARATVLRVGVLYVVCMAVYAALRHRYGLNPGGSVQPSWLAQWRFFSRPKDIFLKPEETYGVRMVRAFTVLPLALLGWTMARGWGRLPRQIRWHGMLAAMINVPLFLLFCAAAEFRDFSMLSLVLLLTLAGNLRAWMEGSGRLVSVKDDGANGVSSV